MNIINLREWDVSYTELIEWAEETDSSVFAVIHHGGNGKSDAIYGFEKEEDLLAFQLKFKKHNPPILMGYKSKVLHDVGYYNCPYIPKRI